MEDFPAGPTSPGPGRPPLAVVIPVRNGGRDFERCLRRLRASSWTDYELVVVDDASTDGSAALAESFGARVLRHEHPLGPAAARNAGAQAAVAPIVFFLDADVELHADALALAIERFACCPDLAALFGSYDDKPTGRSLVSQFRNLLHHYIHQRGSFQEGARPAHTFWTGCGAIRKHVFHSLGGFDPHLYRRPAIEDIELGYRITRAGLKIELVRAIQATHLKRWSLLEVIRTDIFQRGVPWMFLIKREQVKEADLNVSHSQRASVAATGLGLLALLAMPWKPSAGILVVIALTAIISLNLNFYLFLVQKRGLLFAIASIPLHALYFCCCGLSVVIALFLWYVLGGARERPVMPARQDAGSKRARPHAGMRRPTSWTRR
ncbi:MAG TPA: glycosyltransferase family A protein [Isosphaeraceae bacterium]|nr:glycosyltransferase family A protein [Isosphaeraceae bacterium]